MLQKAQSAGAYGYTPSWVKYRYGAWYLQPKLWKKHPVDEPLRDPREPKNKEVSEAKSKSLRLVRSLSLSLSTKPSKMRSRSGSATMYTVRLKNDPTPKMCLLGNQSFICLKIFAPNFVRLFSSVLSINVLVLTKITLRIRNWRNAKLKVRTSQLHIVICKVWQYVRCVR